MLSQFVVGPPNAEVWLGGNVGMPLLSLWIPQHQRCKGPVGGVRGADGLPKRFLVGLKESGPRARASSLLLGYGG